MFKTRIQKAEDKKALLNALKELSVDLEKLGPVPGFLEKKEVFNAFINDGKLLSVPKDISLCDYAVRYFNIVAKFQNKNLLKKGLLTDSEYVRALMDHFERVGRCSFASAEEKINQEIRNENVFFGKNNWVRLADQIYRIQAFLNSHVESMKKLIVLVLAQEEHSTPGIVDRMFEKYILSKQK